MICYHDTLFLFLIESGHEAFQEKNSHLESIKVNLFSVCFHLQKAESTSNSEAKEKNDCTSSLSFKASKMNEQQKLFEAAAAAAAAAAVRSTTAGQPAATMTPSTSAAAAAAAAAAASNPYTALAALAAASGTPTSPYLRPPFPGTPGQPPAPASPAADSSWMMNPLIQAALRQQQLQWISQIASMSGSPFMNPLAMASLGGNFSPAASTPPLPPLIPATSSESSLKKEAPPSQPATTVSSNSGLENVYREYLNKIVESKSHGGTAASEAAAEVMANLIKASSASEDTNGNSKSKLYEREDTSPKPLSVTSVSPPTSAVASALSSRGVRTNGQSKKEHSGDSPSSNYNGKEKVFTCKTCNRSFGYKHVLQNHERTHTGEKPFECKVCHKRFTRDHHLKTHMRLHTGEKPYSCTHCDRQFVQVANLRRHLRVHTGERPYKCEICESCFSDSNQLKAHILIHKGEKPFACDKCDGKFRRRHHLMHHVCPLVPGSSQTLAGVDPSVYDDDDSDERFILAAKRARSASMKEGMYEDSPPSLLASTGTPSSLELSLMLAQARAAQERALRQMESTTVAGERAPVSASGQAPTRSRKSRDPKRVNPSASPSDAEELPQSEPEDLSSKKSNENEDVNLDLLAITSSAEVTSMTSGPPKSAPTLSQMPIANK